MTAPNFAEAAPRWLACGTGAEFARYFVCSALALGADFGLFSLALWLGLSYPLASVFGFVAGLWTAYQLSVRYAFKARALGHSGAEFVIFAAVGIFGLLLTEALLWVLVSRMGMQPLVAKVLAAGVVFVSNFALRKGLLFTDIAQRRVKHEG
jgi:putative flippase GtrA